MIAVEEAERLMMAQVPQLPTERFELEDAVGRYTAEEVLSPKEHPLFDMSAVDGYTFRFDASVTEWKVVGEVQAGAVCKSELASGECLRIFTGAMVPTSADTVVMQEFVSREGDLITYRDPKLKPGGNVRRKGEQLQVGGVLLEKGRHITPEAIGLLASVGIHAVSILRPPRVHVVLTGNEFLNEQEPSEGRIHSSNGFMLGAALRSSGVLVTMEHVPDDRARLDGAFSKALAQCDVILSTGGVSVGDHDLVREAVEMNDGLIHFHGVAQKPGKPMLFATVGGKPFFGLPGNPRAVMVLYWEYVLPFLRAMQGAKDPFLLIDRLPLDHAVTAKGDRAEFRAALVRGGRVSLLKDEGSHMLRSLLEANAIAYLPSSVRSWEKGADIEVHYLPR